MWPLTVLTGGRINKILIDDYVWPFSGPSKSGRSNQVTVLADWPYGTVALYIAINFPKVVYSFCDNDCLSQIQARMTSLDVCI